MLTLRRALPLCLAASLASAGCAQDIAAAPGGTELTADSVVIVMRHGVRPPTKAVPLPAGTVRESWPEWSVPPGWLTRHGTQAVARIGEWDAARLRGEGLLPPQGCPSAGSVKVIADSDQRTIATADAWLAAALPGCGVASEHHPQDEADPAFSAIAAGLATLDPDKAQAAVAEAAGPGGIAAVERSHKPLLDRLDTVLCGTERAGCGVSGKPSGLKPAKPGGKPGLTGALDLASTAGQALLLEYADGKPLDQVGWGRANAADIAALSSFHALEFRLLARPRYLARANFAGLAPLVEQGLLGAKVTVIVGHDTNVANLAGLLDVHWQVPGIAQDDPAPGGAIVLTRLHDRAGHRFVRIEYRSQTLEQLRSAAPLAPGDPYRAVLAPKGCAASAGAAVCPWETFERLAGPAAD